MEKPLSTIIVCGCGAQTEMTFHAGYTEFTCPSSGDWVADIHAGAAVAETNHPAHV